MKEAVKLISKLSIVLILFSNFTSAQDTIYIYDIASHSVSNVPMPPFNVNAVTDSTDPSFGIYGDTQMPTIAPVDTYPNTQISVLKKASDFYANFNFPFTAVSLIRYGMNITAAVVGRRSLLVFNSDVYDAPTTTWRNLHDANPYFENGTIQFGATQIHPLKYYVLNLNKPYNLYKSFAVIEVAENIGDSSGFFGLAFDTTQHSYDSKLLYNISYPAEGYPNYYSSSVNGDTLCMKYGIIKNPDDFIFNAYWGGNGEYASPFFDANFRIHGLRWTYGDNYKLGRTSFYFLKYVTESLATDVNDKSGHSILSIYPNPFTLSLNISLPANEKYEIKLYDIMGKVAKIFSVIGEENYSIKTNDLAEGLYFISVESGNKLVYSSKVIHLNE